jgi:hypothetical protein
LEGKRTGRPSGSRNYAKAWADVEWAYQHRHDESVSPPNATARFWWRLAVSFPGEFEYWFESGGRVVDGDDYHCGY